MAYKHLVHVIQIDIERSLMKKLILSFITIFMISIFAGTLQAQQSLRINSTIHSPSEAIFVKNLEEVFKRLGIQMIRQTPPVGRALLNVNEGIDDGDGPRLKLIEGLFPNMIRVPESFGNFHFVAFSNSVTVKTSSWESLVPYHIAYIHGWKLFDAHVVGAKSVTKVKNAELLFKLLQKKRTELVLTSLVSGLSYIQESNLQGIELMEPSLLIEPKFLFLHKKHKDLVPRIASTLREMKKDGTYQLNYEEILKPYPQIKQRIDQLK